MYRHSLKKQLMKGFTLVELLIVVIILAILAAIVVPQFSGTTKEAEEASLRSNLAAIRSAVDLYYQQHSSVYPGAVAAGQGVCTADVSALIGAPAFEAQLKFYTNKAGAVCNKKETGFVYGPYLKKGLSKNPVTGIATLVIPGTPGDLNMTDDGGVAGWKFDTLTGKFIANDNTTDADSVAYSVY